MTHHTRFIHPAPPVLHRVVRRNDLVVNQVRSADPDSLGDVLANWTMVIGVATLVVGLLAWGGVL